jgi:hypothetical protein
MGRTPLNVDLTQLDADLRENGHALFADEIFGSDVTEATDVLADAARLSDIGYALDYAVGQVAQQPLAANLGSISERLFTLADLRT